MNQKEPSSFRNDGRKKLFSRVCRIWEPQKINVCNPFSEPRRRGRGLIFDANFLIRKEFFELCARKIAQILISILISQGFDQDRVQSGRSIRQV